MDFKNSRQSRPESGSGPGGGNTTYWLEKQGYLQSQSDARRLFILHLILLALEPIEGYWILTGWYQLFLPGSRMRIPESDQANWEGHFAKYICIVALVVGISGFVLAGAILVLSTLVHLYELWAWKPKGESDARK